MPNQFIEKHEEDFQKSKEHFLKELNSMRVGRATPSMLENVLVDAYGVKTPINQVGSISVPEPKVMTVEPWDKNLLKEVEKAIVQADLGLGVTAESTLVRITVPQLTEESRMKSVKQLNEKLEAGKVSLKGVREKIKEEIVEAEKNKEITEDDKYAFIEELDKKNSEMTKEMQEMAVKKEEELMKV